MRTRFVALTLVAIVAACGAAPLETRGARVAEPPVNTAAQPDIGELPPDEAPELQEPQAEPLARPQAEALAEELTRRCQSHALEIPEGKQRPGHTAAYEPEAVTDARAIRLSPPRGEPLEPGDYYAEAINPQHEAVKGCGGTFLAWQYIPSAHFRLQRIVFPVRYGQAALLVDDCGRPGQVLGRANVAPGQQGEESIAQFDPPLEVHPDRAYWVWRSSGPCGNVRDSSGAQPVYYGNFSGLVPSGWEGPWRSHAFKARMSGRAL